MISYWGIEHGDEVAKHYLGHHGEGQHHDRTQHGALRFEKKKARKTHSRAASTAYHTAAKTARDKGSDTWYNFGEGMTGVLGGDEAKARYRINAGPRPSDVAGSKGRNKYSTSDYGLKNAKRAGRTKADWNPRWGERNGYKKRDVRKAFSQWIDKETPL